LKDKFHDARTRIPDLDLDATGLERTSIPEGQRRKGASRDALVGLVKREQERRVGRLALGKLSPELMSKYVFGMTGAKSSQVILEPSLGLDFGVVRLDSGGRPAKGRSAPRRYLIVSSDPITGVSERAGWYAVNVSANDIATSGNRPQFMQSVVLLPAHASEKEVRLLIADMHETAGDLGIAIVGGHTEVSPGLDRPLVVTTAFALADSFVTTAGAKNGDILMMTKTAGVEGTAIIGTDPRFGKGLKREVVAAARGYFEKLSVVEEAVAAFGTGKVHAMHDCTEGGVLGAVYEMSYASNLGFELQEERIPLARETTYVCSRLGLDPLRLISSGTLLLAVKKGAEDEVSEAVRSAGSRVTAVGRFRRGERVLVRADGKREIIGSPPTDELWKLVDAKGM
jgi:hydrogenase expression/formation protein HypE